jgi:hypothetical protein
LNPQAPSSSLLLHFSSFSPFFSNFELLHSEHDFSHLGPYFDDPNGQKLRLGVVNLALKLFNDPTSNESAINVLVGVLQEKRECFFTSILSLL